MIPLELTAPIADQLDFLFIGDFPRAGLSMQELPELP
jgi:hypothetical protein